MTRILIGAVVVMVIQTLAGVALAWWSRHYLPRLSPGGARALRLALDVLTVPLYLLERLLLFGVLKRLMVHVDADPKDKPRIQSEIRKKLDRGDSVAELEAFIVKLKKELAEDAKTNG